MARRNRPVLIAWRNRPVLMARRNEQVLMGRKLMARELIAGKANESNDVEERARINGQKGK